MESEAQVSPEVQAETWADEMIALLDKECPSSVPREGRGKQRDILVHAFKNNFHENIEEAVEREKRWCEDHDDPPPSAEDLARIVRGHAFEQLAIAALPEEEHKYPELEEFILKALKEPELWKVLFENIVPEEIELYEKYFEVMPRADEMRSLRNNDAIAVKIEKDETTGQSVALITGVVEAKNYRLYGGSAQRQAAEAPATLVSVVNRFKEVFPLLVRSLGLSAELPENIDIVPEEELKYTFVQPYNVRPPRAKVREKHFPNCTFSRIPFSQEESVVIASTIMPEARDRY